MHRHILIIVGIFLGFFGWGQEENTWVKKTAFGGLKREKAVAFALEDRGYVSCGVDTAEITHNDLWEYNPESDTWTQLASLPGSARRNAVAFTIGTKAYIGTGLTLDDADLGTKLKDLWEYDPSSNSWNAKADFPGGGDTGIYQATAFSVLGKGYIACGKIGSNAYISELWEYNPDLDSWTERTPFPGGDRYQLMSFALENKAYVGLGTDHDVFRKDIWEYDPVSNTWESQPDFPGTERAQASTFTIGVKGFVVFGTDGGVKDELWEYNYYTESWTSRAPFAGSARRNAIAFTIGNTGYAGLGKGTSGKKSSFYAYTPTGPLSLVEMDEVTISVYPNPSSNITSITLPEKLNRGSYLLIDAKRRIVSRENFNQSVFQVNLKGVTPGLYQLVILDHYQIPMAHQKIIVE